MLQQLFEYIDSGKADDVLIVTAVIVVLISMYFKCREEKDNV